MTETPLAAIVMAGGLGTRMKSAVAKHFHPILGRRMVDWVIESGRAAGASPLVVVASPAARGSVRGERGGGRDPGAGARDGGCRSLGARRPRRARRRRARALGRHAAADARACCSSSWREHRRQGAAATLLSAIPPDPRRYGRVVRDGDGGVARVVEASDATPEELAIGEVNTSIYVFRADALWPALEQLQPKNAQGELYLTDAIEILVAAGEKVAAFVAPESDETDGVNTRVELAAAGANPPRSHQRAATCSPA